MKRRFKAQGINGAFEAEVSVVASSYGSAAGLTLSEEGKVIGFPDTFKPDRLINSRLFTISVTVNGEALFNIHSVSLEVLRALTELIERSVMGYISELANTEFPDEFAELQLASLGYL